MRISVSGKVFFIFFILTFISLLTGGVVLYLLDLIDKNSMRLSDVRKFQMQVAILSSIQSDLAIKHSNDDDLILAEKFQGLNLLADDVARIGREIHSDRYSQAVSIPEQVEFFRVAYMELLDSYRMDVDSPKVSLELFNLLEYRMFTVSEEVRSKVLTLVSKIIVLHSEHDYAKISKNVSLFKAETEKIIPLLNDKDVAETLNVLISIAEKKFFNLLAINDRLNFLNDSASHFFKISEMVSTEILRKIIAQQRNLKFVIYAFCGLFVLVTSMLWLMATRYFKKFLIGHNMSVNALQAGDYDFELPEVSKDELGDQIRLVKEISGTVKENLYSLAESEKKFRNLVENISDWIWSVDSQGNCLYSSPRAENILGISAHEVMGQKITQLLGNDVHLKNKGGSLVDYINRREPFDDLFHSANFNNKIIEMETSGRPILDKAGAYKGFRLVSSDVSIRRQAEIELQRKSLSQNLLNQILELALENVDLHETMYRFLNYLIESPWLGIEKTGAIFLTDNKAKSLHLAAQIGFSKELKHSCTVIPFGVCLCGKAALSGKVVFAGSVDERHEITHPGMHLHGHYCVPIHTVAGEVMGVFTLYLHDGALRDRHVENFLVSAATLIGAIIRRKLTEEENEKLFKEMEDRVAKRTAQLSAANQELDTFAYSVSHDLKAPLRAIDGFSLALLEDYGHQLDDEGQSYLSRVRLACERMDTLIKDVLSLSRLTRGEMNIELINLSEMAFDVFEEIRAGDSNRQVDIKIDDGLQLNGDPVMMRAVMTNLIGNAWKYSSKNEGQSKIEVGQVNQAGKLTFFVKDNGAGFDMKYADKLFVAFQRLHSSSDFPGTGIGLSTVQRIIHRHQGKIWAEGEIGKGAVFYFNVE